MWARSGSPQLNYVLTHQGPWDCATCHVNNFYSNAGFTRLIHCGSFHRLNDKAIDQLLLTLLQQNAEEEECLRVSTRICRGRHILEKIYGLIPKATSKSTEYLGSLGWKQVLICKHSSSTYNSSYCWLIGILIWQKYCSVEVRSTEFSCRFAFESSLNVKLLLQPYNNQQFREKFITYLLLIRMPGSTENMANFISKAVSIKMPVFLCWIKISGWFVVVHLYLGLWENVCTCEFHGHQRLVSKTIFYC